MEILADKYKLSGSRPGTNTDASYNRNDIFGRLLWFVTLSEEERLKAGIYVGNEGREWIERSALILAPTEE